MEEFKKYAIKYICGLLIFAIIGVVIGLFIKPLGG